MGKLPGTIPKIGCSLESIRCPSDHSRLYAHFLFYWELEEGY